MTSLRTIADRLDRLIDAIGRITGWSAFALVLVMSFYPKPVFHRIAELPADSHESAHEAVRTLLPLSQMFQENGHHEEAARIGRFIAELARVSSGDDHPLFATALSNQAVIAGQTGDQVAAIELFRSTLGIYERAGTPLEIASAHQNLGEFLRAAGKKAEALQHAQRAVELKRSVPDTEPTLLANSLNTLARVLSEVDQWEQAESLFREVAEIHRLHSPPHHPDATAASQNLTFLYRRVGRIEEAVAEARKVVESLALTAPGTVNHLQMIAVLADVESTAGRPREAERLLRAALEITDTHPNATATLLRSLASALGEQGNLAEAEKVRLRELEIRTMHDGDANDIARCHDELTELAERRGDLAAADAHRSAARQTRAQLGRNSREGQAHGDPFAEVMLAFSQADFERAAKVGMRIVTEVTDLLILQCVAVSLLRIGRNADAKVLHQLAALKLTEASQLKMFRAACGQTDSEPLPKDAVEADKLTFALALGAITRNDLTAADHFLGQLTNSPNRESGAGQLERQIARSLRQSALFAAITTSAASTPRTAATAEGLRLHFRAAFERGEYAAAAAAGEQLVEALRRQHGDSDERYLVAITDLGIAYHYAQDYERASVVLRTARDVSREVFGARHYQYAMALEAHASLFSNAEDFTEALALSAEAVDILLEVNGQESRSYATALNNRGAIYLSAKDYASAEPLLREAEAIRKRVLGVENEDYAVSLNNLTYLCRKTNRMTEAVGYARRAVELRARFGTQHQQYWQSLDTLANICIALEDWDGAVAAYEPLLAALDAHDNDDMEWHARVVGNLGVMLDRAGRSTDAEPVLQRAVKLNVEAYGPHHHLTQTSLNYLREYCARAGDPARADQLAGELGLARNTGIDEFFDEDFVGAFASDADYLGCLQFLVELQPPAHIQFPTGILLQTVAQHRLALPSFLGQLSGEMAARLRAEEPWTATLAELVAGKTPLSAVVLQISDDRQAAQAYYFAATRALDEGNAAAAEEWYKRSAALGPASPESRLAAATLRRFFPDADGRDPVTAERVQTVKTVLHRIAADGAAGHCPVPLMEAIVRLAEPLAEIEPKLLNTALHNLASVYHRNGNPEAESLFRRCLELTAKIEGMRSPEFAATMHGMASYLATTGREKEAIELFYIVLEMKAQLSGRRTETYANSLVNLARCLRDTGRIQDAIAHLSEAIEIDRETSGVESLRYVQSLKELAEARALVGDSARACEEAREAVAIAARFRGPVYFEAIRSLATVSELCDQWAEALKANEFLFQHARQQHGARSPQAVREMLRVARAQIGVGQYTIAERLAREALNVAGDDAELAAKAQLGIGEALEKLGEWAEAEEAFQKARAGVGALLDVLAVQLLAGLYRRQGRITAARELILNLIAQNPADILALTAVIDELVAVHIACGDYAAARQLINLQLRGVEATTGEASYRYSVLLAQQGELHLACWDLPQAEECLRQAEERMAAGSLLPLANVRLQLTELNRRLGKKDEARNFAERAASAIADSLPPRHPDRLRALDVLAELEAEAGDITRAVTFAQQAVEISRTEYGASHPVHGRALFRLGSLYRRAENLSSAETLVRRATEIEREAGGAELPGFADLLAEMSAIAAEAGRLSVARERLREAIAIDDACIRQVFAIASERQRSEYLQAAQARQFAFLDLARTAGDVDTVRLAFDLTLRRKGLTIEALAAQRDAVANDPGKQRLAIDLRKLRQEIAARTLAGPAKGETADEHARKLAGWVAEREKMEEALAGLVPENGECAPWQAVTAKAVADAIPPGTCLIEYVRIELPSAPARYLAFVLHSDHSAGVRLIDLQEAAPIDAAVQQLRAAVLADGKAAAGRSLQLRPFAPTPDYNAAGNELRSKIFDPLVAALAGRTELIVAPDGALNLIPVDILPSGSGHLIDRFHVSYLGSGRDALRLVPTDRSRHSRALVLADPDFDLSQPGAKSVAVVEEIAAANRAPRWTTFAGRDRCTFDSLAGARREALEVATFLGVTPAIGADAVKKLIQNTISPVVLHLATHGVFFPRASGPSATDNPLLRSVLALAGANDPAGAGLLTAEEVAALELGDTELVVLSACETGLGEVRTGDGVYGLRRAFQIAGARTLVMTLWKVDDEATYQLIVEFYRRVQNGEGRAEALRQARLTIRASRPQAFFWGGFICQGTSGPLSW